MEPLLAKLRNLMTHSGMGSKPIVIEQFQRGHVFVHRTVAHEGTLVEAGDDVSIEGHDYKIVEVEGRGRLLIAPVNPPPDSLIPGRTCVHAGYQKCLTLFFRRVMDATVRSRLTGNIRFRHFFHRLDEFYRYAGNYTISSINGHALDLDRFEDVRVTRFVRDPRDMLVSSYFYHRRGAEGWCNYVDPTTAEWDITRGEIPRNLPAGYALSEYLNEVSLEEGLNAEIDLRRRHFESMLAWPDDDARVRVFHFEKIAGNEARTIRSVLGFYGMSRVARLVGAHHAAKVRASKRSGSDAHMRDHGSGYWREYFTPELTKRFNVEFGGVLEKLGYPEN